MKIKLVFFAVYVIRWNALCFNSDSKRSPKTALLGLEHIEKYGLKIYYIYTKFKYLEIRN